jgi:hypothetical protein
VLDFVVGIFHAQISSNHEYFIVHTLRGRHILLCTGAKVSFLENDELEEIYGYFIFFNCDPFIRFRGKYYRRIDFSIILAFHI